MATYKQIQAWVKQKYGFIPKTCWTTHVKHMLGFPTRKVPNRKGVEWIKLYLLEKAESVRAAFKCFWMIPKIINTLLFKNRDETANDYLIG